MFKKFTEISNVSSLDKKKQKEFKAKIIATYPKLEKYISEIIPNKCQIQSARPKIEDKSEIFFVDGDPLFFIYWNKIIPNLKICQKYPFIFDNNIVQIDKGATKHIISGSDIMAPGLLSEGGKIEQNLQEKAIVLIFAEGKESPLAIGSLLKDSSTIIQEKTGLVVKNLHYISDGLWLLKSLNK